MTPNLNEPNLAETLRLIGDQAQAAARRMVGLSTRRKNAILNAMAEALEARRDQIREANDRDLEAARSAGIPAALLDRLTHKAHIILCNWDSYRIKESLKKKSSRKILLKIRIL